MDFLTLAKSKGGYQHILVITDQYTRYALAIPTKNQFANLASKIGLVANIEFCLFLDVPYHHVGLVTLLVYVQQVRQVSNSVKNVVSSGT
jgi:hypothetical protein